MPLALRHDSYPMTVLEGKMRIRQRRDYMGFPFTHVHKIPLGMDHKVVQWTADGL